MNVYSVINFSWASLTSTQRWPLRPCHPPTGTRHMPYTTTHCRGPTLGMLGPQAPKHPNCLTTTIPGRNPTTHEKWANFRSGLSRTLLPEYIQCAIRMWLRHNPKLIDPLQPLRLNQPKPAPKPNSQPHPTPRTPPRQMNTPCQHAAFKYHSGRGRGVNLRDRADISGDRRWPVHDHQPAPPNWRYVPPRPGIGRQH